MRLNTIILMLLLLTWTGCSGSSSDSGSKMCADGGATVLTWEDLNGNGVREEGEPPLSSVCVDASSASNYDKAALEERCKQAWEEDQSRMLTSENGEWGSGFLIGACGSEDEVKAEMDAQCKQVSIFVIPPPGYQVTTANQATGCQAEFGLAPTVEIKGRRAIFCSTPVISTRGFSCRAGVSTRTSGLLSKCFNYDNI